jgi:hypothetical protein
MGLSNAFKNFGTMNEAVASDPIWRNSLRLNSIVIIFSFWL